MQLVGEAVVVQQAQLLGGQAQQRGAEPLVGLHMFLQVVLHAVCSGNKGETIAGAGSAQLGKPQWENMTISLLMVLKLRALATISSSVSSFKHLFS